MKMQMGKTTETSRHNIKGFEGLFGILFCFLAGLIFFNSQLFVIKEINVEGNRQVSTEDILLSANINLNQTIFQLDQKRMRSSILQNPRIARVEVTSKFPNKVLISVKERSPLYLLAYLDNLVIIAEDAVVIGVKDENDPIKLPVVTGLNLGQVKIGSAIEDPQFKMALAIFAYTDENIHQLISEIDFKNYQIYLDLPNSDSTVKVELGNAEQIEKKMYNLRAILSHSNSSSLTAIDLRAPELPTVRTKQSN